MQFPRISPKGWFWGLTMVAFVWAYVGTRTTGASGNSLMMSTQKVVSMPVRLLVAPGSWLVTSMQGGIASVFRSMTASQQDKKTVASLEGEVKELEDEVAIRDGQVRMLTKLLADAQERARVGISPGDVLRARIYARNMGAGSGLIFISKGTADGVQAGMPVLAGENNVNNVIGRVWQADTKTSVVRLITYPGATVQATISRRMPGGATKFLLKEPCLVEGQGNGVFSTNTIKTMDAEIQKDDVVQLFDPGWPEKLQYFVLGVVSEVRPNSNQMLRYEVRNRANINDIQYVDVYIK